nr:psoralen synthase-like [Malus domestica]
MLINTYHDIMNKLQTEVRGIVGNGAHITEDDLVEMHYSKAVVKETLRSENRWLEDVEIVGYKIKSETEVVIYAWQIARDPKLYKKPEEFEPERFLNGGIDYKGNDFQLIPFGAGRTVCPEIQFAIAVNEIALTSNVHKFHWELPGGASGEDLHTAESTYGKNCLVERGGRINCLKVKCTANN